jgi:hypothetical protein
VLELVNMNRITFVLPVVLLFVMAVVSLNCAQRDGVRGEAYVALEEINKAGISSYDVEIVKIDKQLRETQDSLTKLDQVLTPALKWVEDKKATTDINAIPCG